MTIFLSSVVVGIISGVVSFYSNPNLLDNMFSGAIFGVFSYGLFIYFKFVDYNWKKMLQYIAISFAGFFIAAFISANITAYLFIPGSLVGSLILGYGLKRINLVDSAKIIKIALLGIFLGPVFTFLMDIKDDDQAFFWFLVIWQTVMMTFITRLAGQSKHARENSTNLKV